MTEDATKDMEAFMIFRITGSTFTGTAAEFGGGSILMGSHSFKQEAHEDESYI